MCPWDIYGPRATSTNASGRIHFAKGGAHLVGREIEEALRHVPGLVERETDLRARQEQAGNGVFARFLQSHLPEQQRLRLVEFGGRHVLGLHGAQVARDEIASLGDIQRIAAEGYRIDAACLARRQDVVHVVDEAGDLPSIVIRHSTP
jgi:hypothetical protein